MAILRVKDEQGNIIEIPAIKGDKGDKGDSASATDVQINGASITQDGVANIPLGLQDVYGVMKLGSNWYCGLEIDKNGVLKLRTLSPNHIDSRTTYTSGVIHGANYDYAVKCAMTDGKGAAWTPEEKLAAKQRIGIDEWELVAESTLEQEVGYWYALDQDTLNKLVTYNRIKVQWDTNGLESENAQVWVFSNKISITIPKNQQSTIIVDLVKEPSGDMFTGTVTVYNPSYVYAGYSSSTQVRFIPTNMRFDHGGATTAKVRIGNSIKFWGCK